MRPLLIATLVAFSAHAQSVVTLAPDGGVPIRFVVPLGIEAPPDSAAAFRVIAHLPAGVNDELAKAGRELRMEIVSELLPEEIAPETPAAYPRSRLSVPMLSPYPPSMHAQLRLQRGANKLQSPVIVAIADPRASIRYTWPPGADKRAAGCYNCDRPAHLMGKTEADGVYELFTNGRHIAVRPVANVFAGTPYAFYGEARRLELRVPTVMADTIRPPAVLVAANAPPVAGGLLQETTYLHSGELETAAVDLDAGGRAGWNVVLDRTYRSSTIGLSALGSGWDASMFRRLRVLPNGNVEYRDGVGEVWLFAKRDDQYVAPEGLFLRLARTSRGWTLVDQKLRPTTFDDLGRLVSESDEFFDPKDDAGNTIHYMYGSDSRLATIVDPVGRQTKLTWDRTTGLLKEIVDWRGRKVEYEYDGRRLTVVRLPDVANTSSQRPQVAYGYENAGGALKEQLELAPNLVAIRDPGAARVTFAYTNDRVASQQWSTGEQATFTYTPTLVTVRDALGQERVYTVTTNDTTNLLADRAHVTEVRETAVPVWSGAAFGQLAALVTPGAPAVTSTERVQKFGFSGGVLRSSSLDGVRQTIVGYDTAIGAPGLVVKSTSTGGITRTFNYQSGAFLKSVEANGASVESPEPHRGNKTPAANNDSIIATSRYDAHGLLRSSTSSGGTDSASAGSNVTFEYFGADDPPHTRGRVHTVRQGDLVTTITYPSATQTRTEDSRHVVTTTDVDAWDRVVRVKVEKPGDLVMEQTFAYDATGRLERTTEKQAAEQVVTTYAYDAVGRRTSTSTTGIATVGSMTTTTTYDLGSRKITTTHSSGASTITELDALGRVKRSLTATGPGSSPIEEQFAYDLAGNRVFATDMFTASTTAYDQHGRVVASRAPNGTVAKTEYDEWHRPKEVKSFTKDGADVVSESAFDFTPAGTLLSVRSKIDATLERSTAFAWDGGGRTTRIATNGRASAATFDSAGRLLQHAAGAGDLTALTDTFIASEITTYDGSLPRATETKEKGGTYNATVERNTAGDITSETVGPLEWQRTFDELGNVTAASVPGRPQTQWKVDARGAVETETLPDGAENKYAYDGSGAQSEYEDPSKEATTITRDFLGRPLVSTYPDGTTELVEWEGRRVKSVTDRQKRKQVYVYNTGGEVKEIQDGAGRPIDVLDYDNAGRLISWKTAETEVTWGSFDLDGNPKETRQRRFRDASGLKPNPVLLDEVVQQHRWNEHGERTKFSMPVAAGVVLGSRWTKWLQQSYDAMGNVTSIGRIDDDLATTAPLPLMSASYRAAGRPDVRTLLTPGGPIVRTYSYDPASSLLNAMSVTAKGVAIAGTAIEHDGLQTSEARLLGIAGGERASRFAYDVRSRLAASVFATKTASDPTVPIPGRAREVVSAADFRHEQERTKVLAGVDRPTVDPPTATFEEKPGGGHKIDNVTKGPVVRPFGYDGAERVDDGRFIYTFDARGRLIRATEKSTLPPVRRLIYTYSGLGRIVGRRAEYANAGNPSDGDWKLEDRPQILTNDGFPAETTFAWDPITDRLVAVYRAGATDAPLKQIIHGESAYDDPLETTTSESRLYPIYDEAAAGSLQAVLDSRAEVVARNLTNDPYGAHDLALTGVAIDGAAVTARKSASGALAAVDVQLHATEQLSAATLANGVRLAAVDASGAVVRVASIAPSLAPDAYTVRWTLTASEWSALTAPPATSLSIAATQHLRASTWGADVPIMPAPEWALASQRVFSSPELPIEVRESLASLASYLAGIPTGEERTTAVYHVETLALLGVSTHGTAVQRVLSAGFQALPFAEATTGLVYVRERWYDPETGTFLTPDPAGYRDSSNLYAFCGGDPINCSDPTGEAASLSRSGWIVATDNRNGGRIVRFSPAEIAADPQRIRAFLGRNADVDPREADALIERAGAPWATGGDKMRVVAPRAAQAAGVYPLMAITAGVGIGGGVGVAVSAEVGLGFLGTQVVSGFAGGIGGRAGGDIYERNLSSGGEYLAAGAEGAVVSVVIGGVIRVIGRSYVLPDMFPGATLGSTAGPKATLPETAGSPGRTRTGVRRTNQADWRKVRDLWDQLDYGGILSGQNRARIAKGQVPVVDAEWIQHFPGDASLAGEQITIHHIGGTKMSVPLPKSRHIDAHRPGGFRRNPGGPGTSG